MSSPIFKAAGDQPTKHGYPPRKRTCPECGGQIGSPRRAPLPAHNQYVVGSGGVIRQGDQPCAGGGRMPIEKD